MQRRQHSNALLTLHGIGDTAENEKWKINKRLRQSFASWKKKICFYIFKYFFYFPAMIFLLVMLTPLHHVVKKKSNVPQCIVNNKVRLSSSETTLCEKKRGLSKYFFKTADVLVNWLIVSLTRRRC